MIPVNPVAVSLFGATLNSPLDSSSATSTASNGSGAAAMDASTVPFAGLVTEAVGQVQQLELQAKNAVEGLITGKGVDVHEAMIAAQKAGMGFELVLSVRNKALAAYQQVMGMQF